MLRAVGVIRLGLSSTRILAYRSAYLARMARVPSSLHPSTTRISSRSWGKSQARIESRHCAMWRSSLRHGTTTETRGCGLTAGALE